MKRIFVAQHPTEAHLLKGVLENEGIAAEIRGEALFGVRGEIPFTEALPEIWVDDAQVGRALEVLRSQATPAAGAGESVPCSNCGEMLEPQFTACWRCQAER